MSANIALAEFRRRAVSVPFVDLGRDYDGWDCWGLLVCAYRDVYGVAIPTNNAAYPDAGRTPRSVLEIRRLIERDRGQWVEASFGPAPGLCVLLRLKNAPIHVGLVVDRRNFLHAEEGAGTVEQSLTSPLWANRIEGFYRYVG